MRKWEKDLNKLSPKKIYRWLSNAWKDAQHSLLLEKCKSKIQWDIISYQSVWPSSKSLHTINARKGVEKREPSWTVGGNINWYSHYGRRYGDSLKILGIEPPFAPAVPLLGIYPEETKNEKTHVLQCKLQHYLQYLGHGSNLDGHQQMNRKRSCGTCIQWNTTQP